MSAVSVSTGPDRAASELLARLRHPASLQDLIEWYGPDEGLCRERADAAIQAVERFKESFGDLPCRLYRAPCRISLNPHADHQGAWVPYGLHARELFMVASPADDDLVAITNTDPAAAPLLHFSLAEERGRAEREWDDAWPSYIEAEPVLRTVDDYRDPTGRAHGRRGAQNYLRGGILRLLQNSRLPAPRGLRLTLHSDIPQGGGLSSSSALTVLALLAAADAWGVSLERTRAAELAGEAEWYVGTRGGCGDHAAILLGRRGALTHIRFRAPLGVEELQYSRFPDGYELILANSRVRSEKSAAQRLLFNRGVFAYRFAFLALKRAMEELGLPHGVIRECSCLGDLHTGRLEPEVLNRLIRALPVGISCRELSAQFPGLFAAAARGCFGTDELSALPDEIPLRGAAVFGLGRVDRGRAMAALLDGGDPAAMAEFGRLMTITHDGDRRFRDGEVYTESQERLSDAYWDRRVASSAAGMDLPLRHEPGAYGASIAEVDRLVDAALRAPGVLGAGLMGAGGGGYVLILAAAGAATQVIGTLDTEYYRPMGLAPDVEAWRPVGPAGELSSASTSGAGRR